MARNAIKHGLLAREVVITAGDGEENLEEFHSLLEGLWDSYEPNRCSRGITCTGDRRLLVEESSSDSGGERRNTQAVGHDRG